MYYKIIRQGKSDSYPFESNAKFISPDGKHCQQVTTEDFPFPRDLIIKAYNCKIRKYQRKEFIKED